MSEGKSATTIKELEKIPFLNERLRNISDRIQLHPNETVLWVGAGISSKYGKLPTWRQFLEGASKKAEQQLGATEHKIIGDLLQAGRSTLAAELLSGRLGEG